MNTQLHKLPWHIVDTIRTGDVVQFKGGRLRTCLWARSQGERIVHAYFPILRCSWTKRGHTGFDRVMLKESVAGVTPMHVDPRRHRIGARLLREMEMLSGGGRLIDCCEVVGVYE